MPVVNMHASKGECSFAVELQVSYDIFDPTVLEYIARFHGPMSWRVLMVAEIAGGSPRFFALS